MAPGARADNPDAYVHRVLVNTLNDARSRRWNGELPTAELPETSPPRSTSSLGLAVRRALATMSDEHRAVLVLRYFADLSERDTAEALGLPPAPSRAAPRAPSPRSAPATT